MTARQPGTRVGELTGVLLLGLLLGRLTLTRPADQDHRADREERRGHELDRLPRQLRDQRAGQDGDEALHAERRENAQR